ncbi:MAG TPA: beta-propeller fold lactonase family protein, partial [Gemmatimonadaceae bacterium]|nr:beta-propeller fold lactonase family protein [Gemmatimonadaceae bacterium]
MYFTRDTLAGRIAPYASLALTVFALAACADAPAGLDAAGDRSASATASESAFPRAGDGPGAVYTLTNGVNGNAVVAFHRAQDGSLTSLGSFATGGTGVGGTIDPLTSQFAVIVNDDHDALFAVNAGSNEISGFRIGSNGALTLASKVSSHGAVPVSLAVHGNLLYALNARDNSVSGFRISSNGLIVALPHTTRSLATGASGAAAIRFTPDGRQLIVAERVSNRLEVFAVQPDGRLGDPVVTPGNGAATFGFDVTSRNQPIVSETQGSLTSYALAQGGALTPITPSISTGGRAPCWVIITQDGRFAYTTNSGSSFLAGFAVDAEGHLTPLTPGGHTGDS